MTIAIRADSSVNIGSGHVMRCLALAAELSVRGHSILFLCADYDGHLADLITQKGHQVLLLPREQCDVDVGDMAGWLGVGWSLDVEQCQQALDKVGKLDYLIVDHYGIDARWENAMAQYTSYLLVIDDLANRSHQCDLLLDQTYGRLALDYFPLLENKNTALLMGSQFSLLRPDFVAQRDKALMARSQRKGIQQILITMGGMDLNNISAEVLNILASVTEQRWKVKVVLGRGAPHYAELRESLEKYDFDVELLSSVENIASLMAEADLAIGAAGTTSWERCCLGLPTLLIQTAGNQKQVVEGLVDKGAVIFVGEGKSLDREMMLDALAYAEAHLSDMSDVASRLCDGYGVQRVADYIFLGKNIVLRPVTELDIELIYQWQSEREARRYSRSTEVPAYDQHVAWVNRRIKSTDPYFIVICNDQPVGVLRLDRLDGDNEYELSILISSRYSGRGLGTKSLTKLRKLYPSIVIVAEVHEDNLPSHALFKKLGYKQLNGKYYSYSDHFFIVNHQLDN